MMIGQITQEADAANPLFLEKDEINDQTEKNNLPRAGYKVGGILTSASS